jgi:chromosome partitioning protein
VFPDPEPLLEHGPARIAAVCNQKGGVGKTTTTINLGAALAEQGRKVLLVDFDPQGALSVGLGIQPHELDATVYNLLMERNTTAQDVRIKTGVDGMDLLPSNIDLSGAEVQLVHEVGREFVLGRVLEPVVPEYDVILIDCQPSLGLLTVNALACADGVIVPLECEYFALRGVALLMETIDKVSSRLSPKLKMDGLLHHVRLTHLAHPGSPCRGGEGVRRQGLPHGDQPHRAVPRRHGGRRAHHQIRPPVDRSEFLPGTRQGGTG